MDRLTNNCWREFKKPALITPVYVTSEEVLLFLGKLGQGRTRKRVRNGIQRTVTCWGRLCEPSLSLDLLR